MRKQMIAVLTVFCLSALSIVSAQAPSHPGSTPLPDDQAVMATLAGTWVAPVEEVRLVTDFDVSVWGPGASSIRKVELSLQPSGEGTIKVTRSVVDRRGRAKPASVSIEQAHLTVKMPGASTGDRIEPEVIVKSPDRRYPDNPKDCWPLDGLVVKLMTTDLSSGQLELRFDLPDGRGSFGETLTRRVPPRSVPARTAVKR